MASVSSLAPYAPLAAAIVAYVVIRLTLASALARHFADRPNERSLHVVPVPRTGGLGIMAGFALGATLVGWNAPLVVVALALAAVSLADDWRGLPVAVRFGAHFAAAAALVAQIPSPWPWWLGALVVIGIVWMTNLYNFMDGSDGLAGGMALFGFGAYALAALWAGQPGIAWTAACIAAAAAAFLAFNFHPARVFMGDAGSIPLGFLAAAIGYVGAIAQVWPLWFPVLVFSPFIVDATVTIARRLVAGERVWQAHKKHYYQRMVRIGWGHRRVALVEYAAMLAVAAIALAATRGDATVQLAAIGATALAYAAFGWWFDRRWARFAATENA